MKKAWNGRNVFNRDELGPFIGSFSGKRRLNEKRRMVVRSDCDRLRSEAEVLKRGVRTGTGHRDVLRALTTSFPNMINGTFTTQTRTLLNDSSINSLDLFTRNMEHFQEAALERLKEMKKLPTANFTLSCTHTGRAR